MPRGRAAPGRQRLAALACALAALPSPGRAAAPPAGLPPASSKKVSFRADVYPLLATRCLRCHRGSNPPSGVRLDLRAELLGQTSGHALAVPGAGAASRLLRAVAGRLRDKVMPPEGRGRRLTPQQVGLLRAWIDQGLAWDDKILPPQVGSDHWAFRPLMRPAVPRRCWGRNPVDAFIAAGHRARKLTPAAEAPRRVLIRRLSLDLLGLPPGPEEVAAFEADRRP
jgi:hypothetical protein